MRTLDKEQQIEYVYTQGIEQGIEQGQLLTLVGLAKKKYITIEQAAEEADMSIEEFLEKMKLA